MYDVGVDAKFSRETRALVASGAKELREIKVQTIAALRDPERKGIPTQRPWVPAENAGDDPAGAGDGHWGAAVEADMQAPDRKGIIARVRVPNKPSVMHYSKQ